MLGKQFIGQIDTALDGFQFDEVSRLVEQIDPAQFNDKEISDALGHLRRKRLFTDIEKAACVFMLSGKQAPQIRRQWAQAVIEQGRIDQGRAALEALLPDVQGDDAESSEVRGLIGRAHKQKFVDKTDHQFLIKSIDAYRPDWEANPEGSRWHGINLVALLDRAKRDNVKLQWSEDPKLMAEKILSDIEGADHKETWDYGTAMEAAVALDDKKDALRWAKMYVDNEKTDAFELGSTVRQLKEVWQLENTELGKALLPVLEYELLQREGGVVELGSVDTDNNEGFEAVYGNEAQVPLEWMETMMARGKAVARVFDAATGRPYGTGFLVAGSSLTDQWTDELVFVTNSHVVSTNPADEAPLMPADASAEFTKLEGRPKIELGEMLFTDPRTNLDVSIFKIAGVENVAPLKLIEFAPVVPKGDAKQRIYIIGHPEGRELEVSLYDNNLDGYVPPYVRYRSPTEGGNSGSPVFNRRWQTFALHHRTRRKLELNEGVLFEHIKKALVGDT